MADSILPDAFFSVAELHKTHHMLYSPVEQRPDYKIITLCASVRKSIPPVRDEPRGVKVWIPKEVREM